MKTKYFTALEQAALKVFNNLNTLVNEGTITVLGPCFTHCQKMFISRIAKDKDYDFLNKVAVTFVEKHHLNFAVKVILTSINTCFDKKDKRNTWSTKEVVIGRLKFYYDFGDNWKVVEQENIFYSDNRPRPKEHPGLTLKTFISLEEFVSSI